MTKYNSKLASIFMFHNTRNVINLSEDASDSFLRNISSNLPEYSYDTGDHRKEINVASHRSVLSEN
jgi:hypothetical protein